MEASACYHIYNRGNNSQPIFFLRENYLYFLKKVRLHLLPHLDMLAYCLMPNHFHFLVCSKENIDSKKIGNDLKIMLRSYTRASNKQEGRTGSLFQQHTKIKALDGSHTMTPSHSMTNTPNRSGATSVRDAKYPFICFHYIHQNPWKAKIVKRMEDYEMSSFQDYAGLRNGSLCNKQKAIEMLDIPSSPELFIKESYSVQTLELAP